MSFFVETIKIGYIIFDEEYSFIRGKKYVCKFKNTGYF